MIYKMNGFYDYKIHFNQILQSYNPKDHSSDKRSCGKKILTRIKTSIIVETGLLFLLTIKCLPMTLCQFKFLEPTQQVELISKYAVPVVERTEGDYRYKLLHIDTFYVEEKWNTALNELLSYTSFNSEEKLLPYLHTIDLWQLKYLIYQSQTIKPN
jgi:hypothetical protein